LGAKWLIDGASSIGTRFGVSQLLIGLTIVALGTSLPELVINVFASVQGRTDLAIGNVLGSNIINSLLIVGVAATIYPISMAGRKSTVNIWFSLAATLVLFIMVNPPWGREREHSITWYDGLMLIVLIGGFIYYSFFKSGTPEKMPAGIRPKKIKLKWSVLLIVAGIAGLYLGGKWIVAGAGRIATDMGISQTTVGLTIIAAATSLPELVTSVMAAMKKNTDMAVGNAIGSNIFNIFLVLGVSALIKPIPFENALNTEIFILIGATFLILAFVKLDIGKTKKAISRLEGMLLIVAYAGYMFYTFVVKS